MSSGKDLFGEFENLFVLSDLPACGVVRRLWNGNHRGVGRGHHEARLINGFSVDNRVISNMISAGPGLVQTRIFFFFFSSSEREKQA